MESMLLANEERATKSDQFMAKICAQIMHRLDNHPNMQKEVINFTPDEPLVLMDGSNVMLISLALPPDLGELPRQL